MGSVSRSRRMGGRTRTRERGGRAMSAFYPKLSKIKRFDFGSPPDALRRLVVAGLVVRVVVAVVAVGGLGAFDGVEGGAEDADAHAREAASAGLGGAAAGAAFAEDHDDGVAAPGDEGRLRRLVDGGGVDDDVVVALAHL